MSNGDVYEGGFLNGKREDLKYTYGQMDKNIKEIILLEKNKE